jgi:cytochrome c5
MRWIFTLGALAAVAAVVWAGCGEKNEGEAAAAETAGDPPASPNVAAPVVAAEMPSGEALLNARCTVCHTLERVHQKKVSRERWEEIVRVMQGKGAVLDGAEREALLDYLAQVHGM